MTAALHLPRHLNGSPDRRYGIAREYCGYRKPQWVVRFYGGWVGRAPVKSAARVLARAHQAARY
ncbi:hypothetical protein [Hyphomicrobium sp.]|uniref:hypothetical protein n=1 Tax=Hyphomicrobium sp. TaxID=82 RepID=UPI002E312B18|nr:hypothetical protein [Hyphomicrobium sp.]HEX2842136.1 hypothetical protein [Hyphomicrobium sp.]